MCNVLKMFFSGCLMLLLANTLTCAEEVTSQQIKGLDEQVQEIKSEVLSIAAELNELEERLLYPSHTQISVFVSLAEEEKFRLDAVEIQLDGDVVAQHLYTYKELEALRMGGVQRIYTGNIQTGAHDIQVSMKGKADGRGDLREVESFQMHKDISPGIFEITLAQSSITLKNR